MQRLIAAAALMSIAGFAQAQAPIDCNALEAPQAARSATDVAPVAGELAPPEQPLGVPGGVLDQAMTDALSAEQVVYRQQLERCTQLASATPAQAPDGTMGTVPVADAATMPAAPDAPGAAAGMEGAGAGAGTEAAVAAATPAAPALELVDAATYKPRTEFDNTPWRFNMNQNGERMTADAFAAWMEAKGVRVAKGRPPAAAGEGAAADAALQAPEGASEGTPEETGTGE